MPEIGAIRQAGRTVGRCQFDPIARIGRENDTLRGRYRNQAVGAARKLAVFDGIKRSKFGARPARVAAITPQRNLNGAEIAWRGGVQLQRHRYARKIKALGTRRKKLPTGPADPPDVTANTGSLPVGVLPVILSVQHVRPGPRERGGPDQSHRSPGNEFTPHRSRPLVTNHWANGSPDARIGRQTPNAPVHTHVTEHSYTGSHTFRQPFAHLSLPPPMPRFPYSFPTVPAVKRA